MTRRLCIAVIGLGYFSEFHLGAWQSLEDVGSINVTDLDPDRVAWAADRFNATGYQDSTSLASDSDPDIVDIVAPPPAHENLIRAFARDGRTIVCQKPFCTSLQEAKRAVDFAEKARATLIVHENFRFQPWHRTIKQFLDQDGLGQIYQCRFSLRPGDGRGREAYLSRQPAFRAMPRLLIHETGVHFIDLFRWLFGEIRDVYADIRRLNPVLAGEDAGMLLLNHKSGVQCLFDGNRLSDCETDNPRQTMGQMLIEGEKGALRLDGNGGLFFRAFGDRFERPVPLIGKVDAESFGGGCVGALIRHVVLGHLGLGALENHARDYLSVIRATEAAYASAERGQKITL